MYVLCWMRVGVFNVKESRADEKYKRGAEECRLGEGKPGPDAFEHFGIGPKQTYGEWTHASDSKGQDG